MFTHFCIAMFCLARIYTLLALFILRTLYQSCRILQSALYNYCLSLFISENFSVCVIYRKGASVLSFILFVDYGNNSDIHIIILLCWAVKFWRTPVLLIHDTGRFSGFMRNVVTMMKLLFGFVYFVTHLRQTWAVLASPFQVLCMQTGMCLWIIVEDVTRYVPYYCRPTVYLPNLIITLLPIRPAIGGKLG